MKKVLLPRDPEMAKVVSLAKMAGSLPHVSIHLNCFIDAF